MTATDMPLDDHMPRTDMPVSWGGGIAPYSLAEAIGEELAGQIVELLARFGGGLDVQVDADEGANVDLGWHARDRRIIGTVGPAGDPLDRYFVMLHELGHCAHAHEGAPADLEAEREREREAWRWAIANALVPPNAAARRGMAADYLSYLRRHGVTPLDADWEDECKRARAAADDWLARLVAARWPSA
jgi:hypothetical protein